MGLQRRTPAAGSNGSLRPYRAEHSDIDACPLLHEFLTMHFWEPGHEARQTGTLLVFMDGPVLKVLLSDKDAQMQAFSTVPPGEELLRHVESLLESPTTDWRPMRPARK